LADLTDGCGGLLMQCIAEEWPGQIATSHTLPSLIFAELPGDIIELCAFAQFCQRFFILRVLLALHWLK
jgi:hypothetical protein